ncbi:MAG TPA: tryptophan-rich sensory protein [Alphaproteobacteria bacterium]|nr:tryptophan-rich sensory protein [Alphaproteobacteria bacterium]
MPRYLQLAIWIIGYLGVSYGLGLITQGNIPSWYAALEKPSFNPPNWVFPIVWTALYIMVATAGWHLWQSGAARSLKLIFIVYTAMNWLWTPIFFGAHQLAIGFFWIAALTLLNAVFIAKAWNIVRLSAVLMVPLFFWSVFAGLLNYSIWTLNG